MAKPIQLIPSSEKDADWVKKNIMYYRNMIPYLDANVIERQLAKSCGKLKEIDYKYATDPYNINNAKKKMPAKIKNWSFIHTILLQLLSEFVERGFEPSAFIKNSNVQNTRQKVEHDLNVKKVTQYFVNALIKVGFFVPGQTDEQGNPIEPPISEDEIKKEISSIVDEKAIHIQALLNYEIEAQNVIDELVAMWWYFITTGYAVSYRDILDGNVVYRYIKPKNFGFIPAENSRFIEDSEAVGYKQRMSLSDIVGEFSSFEGFQTIYDKLVARAGLSLNKSSTAIPTVTDFWGSFYKRRGDNFYESDNYKTESFLVEHIQWTSQSKMYRKYITNVLGQEEFVDLDDSYVPLDDDIYEERIVNETWEGWLIENEFVIGGQLIEFTRGDYNNPNICRKSYNGIRLLPFVDEAQTITDILDPYQEAYNIVKFVIQSTINKNKEKIVTMPLSLINGIKNSEKVMTIDPDTEEARFETKVQEGSQVQNSLYYAHATSIMFVDDADLSPQQAQIASTLLKQVDLGAGNFLQYLIQYAETIKLEAEDAVGFNRARKGRTTERDAVSNTQQMQYVGSLITEEFFREFNTFIERDMLAIADLSRYTHMNGLNATYRTSDYELATVDVPALGLSYSNIGIKVKNGGKEKKALDEFKGRVLEFAQNGSSPSTVGEILNTTGNFSMLIKKLKEVEIEMAEQAKASQENELALAQEKTQLEKYKIDEVEKGKKYKVDTDAEIEKEKLELEREKSGISELDVIQESNKENQATTKNQLDLANILLKNKDIDSKREIANKQVEIAKVNKN